MKNIFRLDFSNLRGDFFGGLTAGIVALPLALAFGEQTELGAIAGLYGAIAIGLIAAILGGTPTQISGPTAPMTVVSALIISDAIAFTDGDFSLAYPLIIATFVLAGIIEALMGVFRLGKYVKYIPYPVVSGFMSGIGVIIVITQVFPFFGMSAPDGGPLGTIRSIHKIPEIINVYSVGVALITILIIYGFPRITKKVPSTLVALLFVSVAVYFGLPEGTVLKINSEGAIPTGLPDLELGFIEVFSNFSHMVIVLEYAFTLAALGAIDSLLTSVVADNMTKTKHNSDQELIGQGIGNIGAALIGGLPGAGATMRTVININTGGKTKISGIVAGAFLLAVLLGISSLVGHIPNAILAGILITVGIGIVDYKGFRHIRNSPRGDAFVMLTVLFLTVFVDLLVAVAVGMVLATILFMKKIADVVEDRTTQGHLRDFSRDMPWDKDEKVFEKLGEKVYIKHIDGPLFFGFASAFQEMVKKMPEDIEWVIFRMEKVPYVDQSGIYAMEEVMDELYKKDIGVIFVGLQGQPLGMFEKFNLAPKSDDTNQIFENLQDCAFWFRKQHMEEELGNAKSEDAEK